VITINKSKTTANRNKECLAEAGKGSSILARAEAKLRKQIYHMAPFYTVEPVATIKK